MSAVSTAPWRQPEIRHRRGEPGWCLICGQAAHLPHLPSSLALEFASMWFAVRRADLRGGCKEGQLVEARALVVWSLSSLGVPASYADIGRLLCRHDHKTIANLHAKAIWLRMTDGDFRLACDAVSDRFYNLREHAHATC